MTIQPRHTSSGHVRRAMLADAADGLHFLPLPWLAATGRIDAALAAWSRGSLAEVPVGLAWDVLRVSPEYGPETVLELRSANVPLGPVLSGPNGVEFLVDRRATETWAPAGTEVLPHGSLLLCPHPSVTEPWSIHRRCWLVTPSDVLTKPLDLRIAYDTVANGIKPPKAVT